MVRKTLTSQFLTTSIAWPGHLDYYNDVVQGHAFATTKETFPDFLLFFQQCKGFNNTIGPLYQQAVILFEIIATNKRHLSKDMKVE